MTVPSRVAPSAPERIGRYEVLRSLGRGGMAEVFLARSLGPGGVAKLVCIKRILPAVALDPRAAQRFAEEARATLSLQHANIVPVFEFGRDGQDLFLVMEWIEGCDLDRLLTHLGAAGGSRRLSPMVAAFAVAEIAKALAYAHDRRIDRAPVGLVHRDVTPRNILLSRAGEVRLTDFGIARVLGAEGAVAGTPRYMAPEQARGDAPSAGDDLYALGLVLAELLAGAALRSTNTVETAREPVILRREGLGDDVPPELAEVAERLLAPVSGQRLRRAAELHAALAHVLAQATVAGAPDPRELLAALVREVSLASGLEPGQARPGGSVLTDAAATMGSGPTSVGVTGAARAPSLERRRTPVVAALVAVGVVALGAGALVAHLRPAVGPPRAAAPEAAQAAPAPAGVRPPAARASPGARPAPTLAGARSASTAAPPGGGPARAPASPAGADTTATTTTPVDDVVAARAPAARAEHRPQARRSARLRILAPGSWVTVYLDGRKLGDDAGTFEIPAGRHQLVIENPPLHFRQVETITAEEGGVIERTYRPGS